MADTQELIAAEPEHSPEPSREPAPADDSAVVPATRQFLGKAKKAEEKKKNRVNEDNDPLNRFIARRRAQSILALKCEGRKPSEIAEELNIPVKSVYWALYQLRRGGHLAAAEEVVNALDHIIKPLVVERLEERLSNPAVSEELLIATAKGTGIFIDHAKVKNEGANVLQQLVVKFEAAPVDALPSAIGEIHGAPLLTEGELASA